MGATTAIFSVVYTVPIRPGVTLTREAVANGRITPVVRPLKDDVVGSIGSTLWVLMARQ